MGTATAYARPDDADIWTVDCAVSRPEVWTLVAAFSRLAGAWRLCGVCTAARAGAKEFLGSLPISVVCAGRRAGGGRAAVSEVCRLDLATLRWVAMPALLCPRSSLACR